MQQYMPTPAGAPTNAAAAVAPAAGATPSGAAGDPPAPRPPLKNADNDDTDYAKKPKLNFLDTLKSRHLVEDEDIAEQDHKIFKNTLCALGPNDALVVFNPETGKEGMRIAGHAVTIGKVDGPADGTEHIDNLLRGAAAAKELNRDGVYSHAPDAQGKAMMNYAAELTGLKIKTLPGEEIPPLDPTIAAKMRAEAEKMGIRPPVQEYSAAAPSATATSDGPAGPKANSSIDPGLIKPTPSRLDTLTLAPSFSGAAQQPVVPSSIPGQQISPGVQQRLG